MRLRLVKWTVMLGETCSDTSIDFDGTEKQNIWLQVYITMSKGHLIWNHYATCHCEVIISHNKYQRLILKGKQEAAKDSMVRLWSKFQGHSTLKSRSHPVFEVNNPKCLLLATYMPNIKSYYLPLLRIKCKG